MQFETLKPMEARILHNAVNILLEYGWDFFDNHCNQNDMSYCDINRCIAKAKVLSGRDDLLERPLPDNLRKARWEHYTKICRYPSKYVIDVLKRVDASYKHQFQAKVSVQAFLNK